MGKSLLFHHSKACIIRPVSATYHTIGINTHPLSVNPQQIADLAWVLCQKYHALLPVCDFHLFNSDIEPLFIRRQPKGSDCCAQKVPQVPKRMVKQLPLPDRRVGADTQIHLNIRIADCRMWDCKRTPSAGNGAFGSEQSFDGGG